jgi:hypothetical protein
MFFMACDKDDEIIPEVKKHSVTQSFDEASIYANGNLPNYLHNINQNIRSEINNPAVDTFFVLSKQDGRYMNLRNGHWTAIADSLIAIRTEAAKKGKVVDGGKSVIDIDMDMKGTDYTRLVGLNYEVFANPVEWER